MAIETDPIIQGLLDEMKARRISATDLADRAGYDRKTLTRMKLHRHSTRVSTLQDLGAVMGLELVWRNKRDHDVDRVDRRDGQKSTDGAL